MQSSAPENPTNSSNAEAGSDGKQLTVDQQAKTRATSNPLFPRYPQILPPYHVMRIPAMGVHQPLLSHHGLAQVSSRPPSHHMWAPRGHVMAPFGRPLPQAMTTPTVDHHRNPSRGSVASHQVAPNSISARESKNIQGSSVTTPSSDTTHNDQDGLTHSTQRNASSKKLGVKWTPDEVNSTFLVCLFSLRHF